MESKDQKKLHIAMFPWLAYGHLMPYLEVSKFLAQKGHRISYISTPKNINRLRSSSFSPLIDFVELPLPAVDGLPESAESTSELPINKVPYLKKAYDLLKPSVTHFIQYSGVNWIVHDFICYWVPRVATQLGVNSVYFSVTNATTLAFFGPPSELQELSWNTLWPQERKRQRSFFLFGLALILQQDIEGISTFFHTFFRLPTWMWQGFLGSTLSSSPNNLRKNLVRHLLSDPFGTTMIRTYFTFP